MASPIFLSAGKSRQLLLMVALFGLLCALGPTQAKAGYLEATKALQQEDGSAVIAEVSKAVEQGESEGLVIFLNVLSSSEVKKQIRLDHTFTANQFITLSRLLDRAVEKGSPRARWVLLNMPKFSYELSPSWKKWIQAIEQRKYSRTSKYAEEEIAWMKLRLAKLEDIASQGSADAAAQLYKFYGVSGTYSGMFYSPEKAKKWMRIAGELGHSDMAMILGFKQLHWVSEWNRSHSECIVEGAVEAVCFTFNREEGLQWLQKGIEYFDNYPIGFTPYIYDMALLEKAGVVTGVPRPKEAYLWAIYGLNQITDASIHSARSSFIGLLRQMRLAGQLEEVAPDLNEVWDDETQRNQLLYPKNLSQLPSMISEIRAQRALQEQPIVSLVLDDSNGLAFDVYKDGKVTVAFLEYGIRGHGGEQLLTLLPSQLEEFLSKISRLNIENWPLSRPYWAGDVQCMAFGECHSDNYQITVASGSGKRTVLVSIPKLMHDSQDSLQEEVGQFYSLINEYLVPSFLASQLIH